uniref:Uncharacterized protein n=1 Tax=Spongospora subterranea TaxID=70186 RepID=A0A0H5R5W1_9EUKA|eukprot:CRZ09540.1 hypothetical protein [Spongospora subterranea]
MFQGQGQSLLMDVEQDLALPHCQQGGQDQPSDLHRVMAKLAATETMLQELREQMTILKTTEVEYRTIIISQEEKLDALARSFMTQKPMKAQNDALQKRIQTLELINKQQQDENTAIRSSLTNETSKLKKLNCHQAIQATSQVSMLKSDLQHARNQLAVVRKRCQYYMEGQIQVSSMNMNSFQDQAVNLTCQHSMMRCKLQDIEAELQSSLSERCCLQNHVIELQDHVQKLSSLQHEQHLLMTSEIRRRDQVVNSLRKQLSRCRAKEESNSESAHQNSETVIQRNGGHKVAQFNFEETILLKELNASLVEKLIQSQDHINILNQRFEVFSQGNTHGEKANMGPGCPP